jgi:hypothetical protein
MNEQRRPGIRRDPLSTPVAGTLGVPATFDRSGSARLTPRHDPER